MNNEAFSTLEPIIRLFKKNRNEKLAPGMVKYMKDKFPFLGIPRPVRNELQKDFIRSFPVNRELLHDAVLILWSQNEREFHYLAMDLLRARKKVHDYTTIDLCERLILENSWWDSVDTLAAAIIGPFYHKHGNDKLRIIEWSESNELWLIRTAIIFQLKHGADTDRNLLFDLVKRHQHHSDFFIRKAIGWALRQYASISPDEVIKFVGKQDLSPLSRREALRKLSD